MVTVGTNLADFLINQTGPLHYHLPHVTGETNEIDEGISIKEELQRDSSGASTLVWYKREKCFMGIHADWEHPSTPSHSVIDAVEALTAKDLEKLMRFQIDC